MKELKVKILGYVKKKDLFDTEEKYFLVTSPQLLDCGPVDYDDIKRIQKSAKARKVDFDEYVEISFMNFIKKSEAEYLKGSLFDGIFNIKEVSRF